jgi:branched-chain amino acid transport system permease protein
MSGRAVSWGSRLVVTATCAAGLALLPFFISGYTAFEFAGMGTFFVAILGLNILTGYTGQISIGHGAFMGIGGYTTAILAAQHGVPDYWTIPLAGLVTGLAGLVFGIPALRLTGLYLALATFGVAVALPQVEKKWEHLTKGTTGLILTTHSGRWLYGVAWGTAAVLFVAGWLVVRSRLGLAFTAIRDSEIAAASVGVNAARYKVLAFGISAFYAGVAGALYAMSSAYVNPDVFPITLSLYLLIGAVIAGLGSLSGLLAGAAFVEFVQRYAPSIVKAVSPFDLNTNRPGIPSVIFGAVLIVLVLLVPTGVGGAVRRAVSPLTTRLYSRSQ